MDGKDDVEEFRVSVEFRGERNSVFVIDIFIFSSCCCLWTMEIVDVKCREKYIIGNEVISKSIGSEGCNLFVEKRDWERVKINFILNGKRNYGRENYGKVKFYISEESKVLKGIKNEVMVLNKYLSYLYNSNKRNYFVFNE